MAAQSEGKKRRPSVSGGHLAVLRVIAFLIVAGLIFAAGVKVGRRSAKRELAKGDSDEPPIIDVTPREKDAPRRG